MKKRMSKEEHAQMGSVLKNQTDQALERSVFLASRFPQNDPIVRAAYALHKAFEKQRSLLDDDICSFSDEEVPDATDYYYGSKKTAL